MLNTKPELSPITHKVADGMGRNSLNTTTATLPVHFPFLEVCSMCDTSRMTTSEKREYLKQLGINARQNIYEMLTMTVDILDDHEYVDACGGENVVLGEIEERDFCHFGKNPSVRAMLRAFREIRRLHGERDVEVWKEHDFNVVAIIELANAAPQPNPRPRPAYKEKAEINEAAYKTERAEKEAVKKEKDLVKKELDKTAAELKKTAEEKASAQNEAKMALQKAKQAEKQVATVTKTLQEQIAERDARIAELEEENSQLRAEIAELREQLSHSLVEG